MLEHSPLLIHPWTRQAPAPSAALVRAITDEAGQSLGFARLEGDRGASWFAWLRKVRLEVFETDDASHLMTLKRRWGVLSNWEVEDAELRPVGTIYPKLLVSSENQRLGYLDPNAGRILDPMGRVLAQFGTKEPGVVELAFRAQARANPFLCMMMLGSALVMEPMPKIA